MYSNHIPRLLQLLLLVVAIACLPVHGQQDHGRIGGVITDSQGAIVLGASVVVKNERTGEERTATSTESGSYIVSALRPSLYTISATAQSLTVRATGVQLLAGQELNLNLTLQATGVEAKVDIVAAADTGIDTKSSDYGPR